MNHRPRDSCSAVVTMRLPSRSMTLHSASSDAGIQVSADFAQVTVTSTAQPGTCLHFDLDRWREFIAAVEVGEFDRTVEQQAAA